MSHKTQYKTFSAPDLIALENEVNDFIKSLHKNENRENVKVSDITTFSAGNTFAAAVTYSWSKKKKPEEVIQPV